MSLPAQTIELPQPISTASPKDIELDKFIRSKYDTLKQSGDLKLVLTRNYKPNDNVLYQQIKEKLQNYAAKVTEGENQNIDEFLPILIGNIEGRPGSVDPMLLLIEEFGVNIQNIKIEDIIRERTKVNKYGTDKKRETVRECDKKTLQMLSSLYDVNVIKNHRKVCATAKIYLKAYRKFIESVEKNTQTITEMSQVHQSYIEFMKQEIDFNKVKAAFEQASTAMEVEENQMKEDVTPSKPQANKNKKKEDTATTHKNNEGQQAKQEEAANPELKNDEKQQEKQKNSRVRRTKEEIQKERLKKLQEIEAKKRQKQEKQKQKQLLKQKEKAEKVEKQRIKQMERQAKEQEKKAKQQQKEAKQREKQREKQLKQQEREAKQAQRRKKEEQRQKKNNPGQSLLNFFKPKTNTNQSSSPVKSVEQKETIVEKEQISAQNTHDDFLQLIKSQSTPLSFCRERFFNQKMKDQNSSFEPFYINIFSHRSRLEFTNFLINEQKVFNYIQPHFQMESGKYDDSSVEYEDLCGDICNQEADQISVEQQEEEENEENSAIVPDSYLSNDEMSSGDDSKDDVVVNIDKGGQWHFSGMHPIADTYQMYCLYEEQPTPLCLSEAQQSNELTVSLKCELYKEIHGYFGAKDILIKRLALITDRVPKSYLDTLVRQTTTKKANQRLVKPEIIEFLNEQKEGFNKELQEIKMKRDQQMLLEARGKVTEKEREIERLILEEAGTYYIIDLLQFLREKGYKMRKNELKSFIDQRVGPQWDDIRRRMQKMQLKVTQFTKKVEKKQQKNPKEKQEKIVSEVIEQKPQEDNMQQKQQQEAQQQRQPQNKDQMQPQ